jgi:flagellin-specific chaperone FliS
LAITRGKYDEAAKRISKITDKFSELQSSFNALYGYATAQNLQDLSIVIRRALSDRLAELSAKFSKLQMLVL